MLWFGTRDAGSLIGDDQAAVSPADRGFTVGEGVFETLVVRHGRPFALERHLERLLNSAAILRLPAPDPAVVRSAAAAVLDTASGTVLERARLRITYTAGDPQGLPTLMVTCMAFQELPDRTTAITVPWVRNERSGIAGAKSTSYAENAVALAKARGAHATEAILANTVDQLCEGATSNVFVVIDGQALTPALASGCLPGVTRQLVIEWFRADEATLPYDILHTADEIFLTSSTRGIQPVVRLDDRVLDVGPVTARLRGEFLELAADNVNP